MSQIFAEILFILLLVIANAIFAMSEMAVVSARKTRLQQWASEGNARARAALDLTISPDRFLSTIQIGITLVGILAGAFGGATISEQLSARLKNLPLLANYSEAISIGIVVLGITYLSLVVGELLPKRLALTNPERIASFVARPMRLLSVVAHPLVYLLGVSTELLFKLLRIKSSAEPSVTEEEIKILIEQGTQAGIFEKKEQDLLTSVLRLSDRRISTLMTPRLDVVWLDIGAPASENRRKMIASPYSRFPVCRGSLDRISGVVKAKEYLATENPDLTSCLKLPLLVLENSSALDTLEIFKQAHTHLAVVIDEHGAVEGLVTTNDILEAIVGELNLASQQAKESAVKREDGSWLLDGFLPIDEFKEIFPMGMLPAEEKGTYQTLAGFIMMHLGRIPSVADYFEWNGVRFEVVDMDRNRIDKVLVSSVNLRK